MQDIYANQCRDELVYAVYSLRTGDRFAAGMSVFAARAASWKIHDGETYQRTQALVQGVINAAYILSRGK